jgi:hypothetical protein
MLLTAIVASEAFQEAFARVSANVDAVNCVLRHCVDHYVHLHPTSYLAVVAFQSPVPACTYLPP